MPDATPTPRARPHQLLLVVVFLAGLVTPGLGLAFGDTAATRAAIRKENRTPAPAPTRPASWAELQQLPASLQAWFDDHFGFRARLIRWHNMLKLLVFGVEPNDRVLLGEDGWIFVNVEESVADFRGLNPFTDAELDAWQAALEERRDWIEAQGARYLFVVGPSKHSVYAEKMRAEFTQLSATRRLDQLLERLRARTTIDVVDVRPALRAAKADGVDLYYPHGTHWNELGGYHAYAAIMRRLAEQDPSLAPRPLGDFHQTPRRGLIDSWAPKLHLEDLVVHEYPLLRPRRAPWPRPVEVEGFGRTVERFETDDARRPRGLLLRDSFGDNIRVLLAAHFSRFSTAANGRTSTEELTRLLLRERPQVVIDEIVERALMNPVRQSISARPPRR